MFVNIVDEKKWSNFIIITVKPAVTVISVYQPPANISHYNFIPTIYSPFNCSPYFDHLPTKPLFFAPDSDSCRLVRLHCIHAPNLVLMRSSTIKKSGFDLLALSSAKFICHPHKHYLAMWILPPSGKGRHIGGQGACLIASSGLPVGLWWT